MPIRSVTFAVQIFGLHEENLDAIDKMENAIYEAVKSSHPNWKHDDDVELTMIAKQGDTT